MSVQFMEIFGNTWKCQTRDPEEKKAGPECIYLHINLQKLGFEGD